MYLGSSGTGYPPSGIIQRQRHFGPNAFLFQGSVPTFISTSSRLCPAS